MTPDAIRNIATLFPRTWDRHYVASKLRTDPLYAALTENLRGSTLPLLDLGCGLGLSALYLRAHAIQIPIHGLDYDLRKIQAAQNAAALAEQHDLIFTHHDARNGLPPHLGNVAILDILQFFTPAEQMRLLEHAASRTAPGGKLIIRSGLHDASFRFRITVAGDLLAKLSFWMKSGPVHYPTTEDFHKILDPFGKVEITPLWGGTPFNNHLIILSR